MNLSTRPKLLLITVIIVIASVIGGTLGNWIFIYFLDTYYGIPNGNYTTVQTSTTMPIRSPQKNNESNTVATAVSNAESSLVGIFKRSNLYLPKNKASQAVIMTSDGWLMTTMSLPTEGSGNFNEFVVVANDKKVYDIDRVVADNLNKVTFIHLKKASNLPVKDFILNQDITAGQQVIGLEWKGIINIGLVNYVSLDVRSSEATVNQLSVIGLEAPSLFLFDLSGRMLGFSRGGVVSDIDGIQASLNKILRTGKTQYARLGIHYVSLGHLPVESGEGALITAADKKPAIIKGSPAEKAGLQAGDIILSINKEQINSSSDIASMLQQYLPGSSITISFSRKKEIKEIQVTLDEQIIQ